MALITRTTKGSALTYAELDGNLQYLESLNAALPPVTISTTSATLIAATHANRLLICNNASPITLTLSTDGAGGWANDDSINAIQYGAGSVTIVAGAATLRAPTATTAVTLAQYKLVGATRVGTNEWTLTESTGGTGSASNIENAAISQIGYVLPSGFTNTDFTFLGVRSSNNIAIDSSTYAGYGGGTLNFRGLYVNAAAATAARTGGFYNNNMTLLGNVAAPTNGRFPFAATGGIGDTSPTLGTMFMGLSNASSANLNAGDASTFVDCIGIGFDSADTNWQVMYNDGTGVCTKIDIGVNFGRVKDIPLCLTITKNGAGTIYNVKVTNLSSGAIYTSPDLTTNLPTGNVALGAKIVRGSSASAVQVTALFGGFYSGIPA